MTTVPEFHAWGKTARVDSPVTITEKLDGTNGVVWIGEQGEIAAGSRNRWIGQRAHGQAEWFGDDNYGFGQWALAHQFSLFELLGPGYHYGEWWGQGIARGYGQTKKRFQLFDPHHSHADGWDDRAYEAAALGTMPVMYEGPMTHHAVEAAVEFLERRGSIMAPGYMHPEGLVVRFAHNGVRFKKVIDKAGPPKKERKEPCRTCTKKPWTQEQINAARLAATERNT